MSTESAEPDVVYHYTNMNAMMNIVKTASIWATSIQYLNDVSERKYLLLGIQDSIIAYKSQNVLEDPSIFDELTSEPSEDFTRYPFVASFSRHDDSLPQWRSYCQQGNGVAIGFSVDCLKRADIEGRGMAYTPYVDFGAVRYGMSTDSNYLDGLIRSHIQQAQKYVDGQIAVADAFRFLMEDTACFHKHPSFSNEEEYRLTLSGPMTHIHCIDFRSTRSSLVPYVQLSIPRRRKGCPELSTPELRNRVMSNLDRLMSMQKPLGKCDFIERIVVGPTSNMDLSCQAIRTFIKKCNLEVDVVPSEIPFRDW